MRRFLYNENSGEPGLGSEGNEIPAADLVQEENKLDESADNKVEEKAEQNADELATVPA